MNYKWHIGDISTPHTGPICTLKSYVIAIDIPCWLKVFLLNIKDSFSRHISGIPDTANKNVGAVWVQEDYSRKTPIKKTYAINISL